MLTVSQAARQAKKRQFGEAETARHFGDDFSRFSEGSFARSFKIHSEENSQ